MILIFVQAMISNGYNYLTIHKRSARCLFFHLFRLVQVVDIAFFIIFIAHVHAFHSHASHSWHAHSTHSWHSHSTHATHPWHSSHAAHPWHSAHASHAWESLHLRGVHTSESLISFFLLFVLVDPLGPVNLDVLVFGGILGEPAPEGLGVILLVEDNKHVEAGLVPLRLLGIDGVEEFEVEAVLFLIADSLEIDGVLSEIKFVFGDVPEANFNEDSIFALSPLDDRMTKLSNTYSIIFARLLQKLMLKYHFIHLSLIPHSNNITINFMDEQQEQQFELFWHNRINLTTHQQLLVDYDTFIARFSQEIRNHTAIVLTAQQRLWIKSEVDPHNQNQVYKNGYLLFIKNFWSLPSNRTKFFNMKLNLTRLRGQVDPLPMAGYIKISVTYPHPEVSTRISSEYEIRDSKIKLVSTHPYSQTPRQPEYQGFITIGSNEENSNIVIPHSSVNSEHVKIIYTTNLEMPPGVKSTPSFPVDPKPYNRVYIRDISRSNRLKYCVDSEEKYFVVRKGMVLGNIGLVEGVYELIIDSLEEAGESQINSFLTQANMDRVSYIPGKADKPKKVAVSLPMETVTEGMVIDMLDRGLYYPEKPKNNKKQAPKQKSNKQGDVPLKLTIKNLRTLEKIHYSSKSLKLVRIGRDPSSQIILDDILIRPLEVQFESVNDIWFLRKVPTHDTQIYVSPGPYLEQCRSSNRMQVEPEYSQKFRVGKSVEIVMSVVGREKGEDDLDGF